MKGPIFHGTLLCIALAIGYQTWTREKKEAPKTGDVVIWDKSADDFESLVYEKNSGNDSRKVTLETRSDAKGSFLWGEVQRTRTTKRAKKQPAPPPAEGDTPPPKPEMEEVTKTTLKQFPVGESGQKLVDKIASLRALSKVQNPSEEQLEKYGLQETKSLLRLFFKGEEPVEFGLGKKVFGGSDVYAIHKRDGTVYVLSTKSLAD